MDSVELVLILLVIIYLGIFFIHLIWKSTQLEPQLKYYHYGLAFFAIMFMLTRIFFLINDFVYEATLDPLDKQGFYYILGSISGSLAVFGIMFVVEKYVIEQKLHFIPSIIVLIFTALMIFLPRINGINMVTAYTTISSGMAVIIPILYINVGIKVSGRSRIKSFILAIAILVILLGNIFNMGLLKDTYPIFKILSPLTILIGFSVFHFGLLFYKSIIE